MRLPNRESAEVPPSKLIDYLLSRTHAVGKSKAKFFRRVGFDETKIDELQRKLKKLARENEIIDNVSVLHGEKYIIEGELQTPIGRVITIRTVWIIEKGKHNPRFVTAYPANK